VITAKAFAGKHYAVLGLARSGLATVAALLASGAKVTAWDDKVEARAKAPAGVQLEDFVGGDLSVFDSIVVTPGLPLNRHLIAARAKETGVEIIGDIELFARARAELPPHKVVGITGTNGKSTTTALIHHILKAAGVPAAMGGNIGLPILAQDPLPEGGVYVLELSSYQIDLTQSLDCDVAVLLNITPDHLDRYESFGAYAASKARLFEMQSPGRLAIVDYRAELDEDVLLEAEDPIIQFIDDIEVGDQSVWPALQGPHNRQNAAVAIATCEALGVDDEASERALRTYPGLPHRMERVADKGGVLFVNDSKATNPTATAPALAAFERIRWICGGQAKTDNLDECAPHFGHVTKAYTIGEAGEMFASLLSPHMDVAECVTLDEAVRTAASEAKSGDTVLLSPACASFDQFRDFEARGDAFRAAVGGI
jgi:UDP-N-acetylmuramoylalanine--D-glutamate ligase